MPTSTAHRTHVKDSLEIGQNGPKARPIARDVPATCEEIPEKRNLDSPIRVQSGITSQALTFAREVAARGLLGQIPQRGLEVSTDLDQDQGVAVLSAYTPAGPSRRARLEVPVEDLRGLARLLLDLADQVDRHQGDLGGVVCKPVPASRRRTDLRIREAGLRRAG